MEAMSFISTKAISSTVSKLGRQKLGQGSSIKASMKRAWAGQTPLAALGFFRFRQMSMSQPVTVKPAAHSVRAAMASDI